MIKNFRQQKALIKLLALVTIIVFTLSRAGAEDPRQLSHGVSAIEFNQDNRTLYYLTWSSTDKRAWEHDIYHSIIAVDKHGQLITLEADQRYIGKAGDEAQEPVHATRDAVNDNILSVWEDGSGNNAPDVKAQLHKPDGSIIKTNWTIAGGLGSQHSANVVHLADKYLVLYADEGPLSTGGAVVKAKVIDDQSGFETQSIAFSANDEDHWWPIAVSNRANTKALVIWGNDGYAVRGVVLYEDGGVIKRTQPPQDYLKNTQQYFYQALWMDKIGRFVIVARDGAYEKLSDQSQIALIDERGNLVAHKTVNHGIIREAKPAAIWYDCTRSYHVFYPTGKNQVAHVEVTADGTIRAFDKTINAAVLQPVEWVPTGTWSAALKDIDGNNSWQNKRLLLFAYNHRRSNRIVKVPVYIDDALICQHADKPATKP